MYRILSASKDTYITDKIIRNAFRVKDANVGNAATLDLFKLYDESVSGSADTKPREMSRILIKFNLKPLRDMVNDGLIDINSSTFSAKIKLHDIYGGQTTPSNFKLIALPLSQSFDEGIGRDIIKFRDLDSSNYITASVTSGVPTLWNQQGALASGTLGSTNIDVIVSGNLAGPAGDATYTNLSSEQIFTKGSEDLILDVTNTISGTVSNLMSDHGFCIAYSGSYEKDNYSYFVKRFASRHVSKEAIRPKLIIRYDDSISDNNNNFIFDMSGTLYLNNFHRGTLSNIMSGAAATEVSGDNSLILTLKSGSASDGKYFQKIVTASQHKIGINEKTGIYSASFAISQFSSSNHTGEIRNGSLQSEVNSSMSASFTAIWGSLDNTVGYHTGSIVVKSPFRTSFNGSVNRLLLSFTNLQKKYRQNDRVKIRVFIEDRDRQLIFKKKPIESKSQVYQNMFYQIRDAQNNDIIIPFDYNKNSTKLSSDSEGMYFHLYMDSLPKNRSYKIEFLIRDFDNDLFLDDDNVNFSVI